VLTRDHLYTVDLSEMTVTPFPAPKTKHRPRDGLLPLRSLVICWVGDPGYWTMNPDWPSPTIPFYWYLTSEIEKIRRLPDGHEGVPGDNPPWGVETLSAERDALAALVADLRAVLGSRTVSNLGGADGALQLELWTQGLLSPPDFGVARLRVASRAVSFLKRGGTQAEGIARWFFAPSSELCDRSPVETIFLVDTETADLILNNAARRFLRAS
jgi:hypothetical protein